jgi:hypothetical protein
MCSGVRVVEKSKATREEATMKKALLVAVALILVAGAVNAAPVNRSYIGLFTGPVPGSPFVPPTSPSGECSVMYTGSRTTFYMYIFVLPGVYQTSPNPTPTEGLMAVEFRLVLPELEDNVSLSTKYKNPAITVEYGDILDNCAVSFGVCQTGWTVLYCYKAYLYDDVASVIEVAESNESGALQIANCEPGYQKKPLTKMSYLYMNQECFYGTKDATWGAIKSMF